MSDDADNIHKASTGSIAGRDETDRESVTDTGPMELVDEVETNPVHRVDESLSFEAPTTQMQKVEETATPEDETGYMSMQGFEDTEQPTHEMLRDPELTKPSQVAIQRPTEPPEDSTEPGGVSDNAMIRRVSLPPTVGSAIVQPPPVQNPTQPSQIQPPPVSKNPFVRAASFWNLRPPTQPSKVIAPPLNPAKVGERRSRATIAAFTAAVLGVIMLFGVSIAMWMSPGVTLFLSVLLVVPIGAAAIWYARPTPESVPTVDDVHLVAKPLAAACLLALLGPLPWQFGPVRGLARSNAGQSAEIRLAVLKDRSEGVATSECVRLSGSYERSDVSKLLAEGLAGRAAVVSDCITQAGDAGPLMSGSLLQDWAGPLVASRTDPEHACALAESVASLQRPAGEVEIRLLACIVDATPAAQRCCANAIGERAAAGTDWLSQMGDSPFIPDEPTAASLLALTFGGPSVSTEQRAMLKATSLDAAAAQRMAFVLACAATEEGATLGDEFAPVLTKCTADSAALPRDNGTWVAICRHAEDRVIRRRGDPVESLCRATTAVVGKQVVRTAIPLVADAAERARRKARRP